MNLIESRKQFEPKARNIGSVCGKDVGIAKLVVAGNVNLCFDYIDLFRIPVNTNNPTSI